ncbi:MAG: DUF11 domain-containing protein [Pirellulaceae bacterium]|nr:DUF11 domain-containing protein [Pirellulaceae bacterium]
MSSRPRNRQRKHRGGRSLVALRQARRLTLESLERRDLLSTVSLLLESSGGTTLQVDDQSPLDTAAAVGVVQFQGSIDNFSINFTTGSSIKDPAESKLEFSSLNVTSTAPGTLTIRLTDTDFQLAPGTTVANFTSLVGGVTNGTLAFQSFVDNTNAPFGTSTASTGLQGPFGPGSYNDTVDSTFAPANLFSMTAVAVVSLPGNGAVQSFSGNTIVRPETVADTASLGNYVWFDLDLDGVQDNNEPGVTGATVNLYVDANQDGVPDGAAVGSTTTNGSGFYEFTGLAPGSYVVEFIGPNGETFTAANQGGDDQLDSDANTVTGLSPTVTLVSGQNDPTIDAGLLPIDLSLSKSVSNPAPEVGSTVTFTVQLANAAGLSDATNVQVADVLPAGMTLVANSSSVSQGSFNEATLVWTVGTVVSGGPALTLTFDATVDTGGTKINFAQVTAAPNQPDIDSTPGNGTAPTPVEDDEASASLTPPASLGNYVWFDLDLDGVQDNNEPGVSGATVNLYVDTNQDGVPDGAAVGSTTTNGSGFYEFTGLAPGSYVVEFIGPSGERFTTANQGGDDQLDSDANTVTGLSPTVTLVSGQYDPTIDAGLLPIDLSLSKSVSNPAPEVGSTVTFTVQLANAAGLSDATSVLVGDVLPAGMTLVANSSSVSQGSFNEATLVWTVGTVASGGPALTLNFDATVDTGGTKINFAQVTAAPNQPDIDSTPNNGTVPTPVEDDEASASLTPPASLGNYVWFDLDLDGVQDNNEPGVSGATVNLYVDANQDGVPDGAAVGSTTTNGSGFYEFTGLAPGSYVVQFIAPNGETFTAANQGGDDQLDSDANTVTGLSPTVTLVSGQNDPTIDAGIVQLVSAIRIVKSTRVDAPPAAAILIDKFVKPVVAHSGNVCSTTAKPVDLTLQYVPGTSVLTLQESSKAYATGTPDATPDDSYLVVSDGGAKIFFVGTVSAGSFFTATSANAGASEFSANSVIRVFDNQAAFLAGAAALQTMYYHTSCSQPIQIGDVVGSVVIAGVVGKSGSVTAPTGFGDDADAPAGPEIKVGDGVMWTYVVTNPDPGNQPVANVVVVDDAGTPGDNTDDFTPDYVSGDNGNGLLDPGETWVYSATGIVEMVGQYRNIGKVTGSLVDTGTLVMDDDPAHYLGVAEHLVVCEAIGRPVELTFDYIGGSDLQTSQDTSKAAVSGVPDNTPNDSYFFVTDTTKLSTVFSGSAKTFFSGTVSLNDAFTAKASLAGRTRFSSNMLIYLFDNEAAFQAGQAPLQTMKYHTSCSQPINLGDIVGGVEIAGAVGEHGATVNLPESQAPLDDLVLQGPTIVLEVDHPFDPGNIGVPADTPTGPIANLGDKITFTYAVTNPGDMPLSNVVVTDDTGVLVEAILKDNGRNFGDTNSDGLLDPSETWYYQALEIADETGQQMNIGIVTADPNGVTDQNPSHHFVSPLDIQKYTRGERETAELVGLDVCDDLSLDHFEVITLRYDGNNIISNPQGGKATLSGTLADPPPLEVYIVASRDATGTGNLFFSGLVQLGSYFDLSTSFSGASFGAQTYVRIYSGDPAAQGTLLQSIGFHTSCSKPLRLGDVYAGVTFVGAVDNDGDTASLPASNPFDELGEDADDPQDAVQIDLGDKVVFTYKISNLGTTPIMLENVFDDNGTPGDPNDDMYWMPPQGVDRAIMEILSESGYNVGDLDEDGIFDGGESWLFEAIDMVREEKLVGNKGTVLGIVESGGGQVALMDMDMSHHRGVLPAIDVCTTGEHPQRLNLRYTASDEFDNSQGDKAVIRVDNGSLEGVSSVSIRVTNDPNAFRADAESYFDGPVEEGEVFGLDATLAGRSSLPARVYIHLLDALSGVLLRTVEVHTSCSAPLVLGDTYAGVQLVGFVGDEGTVLGLQPNMELPTGQGHVVAGDVLFNKNKLKFTLTNVGNNDAVLESLLIKWASGNKKLRKIKIDGVEIFRTETGWTVDGLLIGSDDWKSGTLANRTIGSGQVALVEFEFERDANKDKAQYDLNLIFDVDGDDDGDDQNVDVL